MFRDSRQALFCTATERLVIAVLLTVVWLSEAVAVNRMAIRRWQTEEGLPQNSVTCLLQAREGYIWFGTYAGLVRFDGVRFTVFDSEGHPGLANNRITALFEDRQGGLWIGHETGNVTRFEQGVMQEVRLPPAVGRSEILSIAADAEGAIWILNREGWLARLERGTTIAPPSGPTALVNSYGLVLAREGTLWCLRRGRLDLVNEDGIRHWTPPGHSAQTPVQAISYARAGGLWVSIDGQVRRTDSAAWLEEPPDQPWNIEAVGCLAELAGGGLVIGTRERGLYLRDATGRNEHVSEANGLGQGWVRSVFEDREGNIWVGLGNGGLNAIHSVSFEGVNPPDRWGGRSVLSVASGRDGSLWAGTEGAGIYRWQDGTWKSYGQAEGLVNRYVWCVAETKKGQLLAGTWGGGLFLWNGERFLPAPGLEKITRPVTALLPGEGDEMWLGGTDGVARYEAGRVTWLREQDGVRLTDVRCLARRGADEIWIGMNGGGLAVLHAGRLRHFSKADGLGSDFISCLYLDQRGEIWIGTAGGGLVRYREGRFARIGSRQGLPSANIASMQEDERGGVWLGSSAGVLQVAKAALDACASGDASNVVVTVHGVGDGLETAECSGGFQPASCRTADGYLWFPTRRGLVRVHPAALVTNPLPPPVCIERFLCQGAEIRLPAGKVTAPLLIPPGRERFEFQFTALSFVAPEKVRFRYRLQGLERDWVEQRQRSVAYSFLQPGDYVFQVIACNSSGVWNDTGAQLAFTVLPHFWQTWWFRILFYATTCLTVAGGVWLETRRRLHRRVERLERQRAVERERTRIAKDIHDDLGASLTRITMLCHSARKELDNPEMVGKHLARIDTTAREVTRTMDETVWAVNPRHDTLDSLAIYIVRFAQDFLGPADVRCRVNMPLTLPAWPVGAEVRHNVFMAYKEAINNIVRHAHAHEVKIALHPNASGFDLVVEDDGQGFDPAQVRAAAQSRSGRPAGRNGLGNMQTRLGEIGGAVEMRSAVGCGTTVCFRVPINQRVRT